MVLIVGLQGAGKTTSVGKLGALLRRQGRSPMLVSVDVHRPAAREQLATLGNQVELPVWHSESDDPVVHVRATRYRRPGAAAMTWCWSIRPAACTWTTR